MEYDNATALIVVDMQNDFADPEGSLYVPDGDRMVSVVNREIDRALEAGAFVVYTVDNGYTERGQWVA
jgi:nicotinamidase/pyrazinamidase